MQVKNNYKGKYMRNIKLVIEYDGRSFNRMAETTK